MIDFSSNNPERAEHNFENGQKRDATKRRLLKKHGIQLIEIKYTEAITRENVMRILAENGVSLPVEPPTTETK